MLSGLLLDVVLAARFGAGRDTDAFFAASRIPIGITALLMTIAVQAWVPLFTRDRRDGGTASLTQFASRMLTGVVGAGALVWLLATVFAHPLMSATAPGLSSAQLDLAASMVPQMFLLVPLVAAAEAVRAALNASYSFVLPAAMNVFMNTLAAGLILLGNGHDIRQVARAYVAGAVFQLIVIMAVAWTHGLRLRLGRQVWDPRVRRAFGLSGRPTVSSVLNLANRTAEQAIASFLPTGSITILSYGQRLISALGGGTFFRPITVALIPRLSDAEHAGDPRASVALIYRAIKLILAVSLPLTVFTIALANPVIGIVFHRGNFSPAATHLLALTLAIYGASLIGSGLQRVLLAPFYARLDTRTPLRNTFYGVLVDLALLYPCIAIFGTHSANGVLGVAVAYSIDQYFIVAHAWFRLRSTLGLRASAVSGFAARALLASLACYAVMAVLVFTVHPASQGSQIGQLLLTAAIAIAGSVILTLAAAVLGGPDLRGQLQRRLRRRESRRRPLS